MIGLYKRFGLLCSLFLLSFGAFSQTPGGVSGSNLKLWVKAGSGITLSPDVAQWNDLSGLNNHFLQGNTTKQPVFVPNDLNFNPTVNFVGATSIMTMTTPTPDLNTTIFSVAIPTVNSNWRTMFRGNANHHPIIVQSGGTALGFYDNFAGTFKGGGFTWLQNEPAMVGLEMRSGDVNFRKNGAQGASINSITLSPANLDNFGNYQGNSQQFGRIAETIIFNGATALTITEKNQIESYLAVKYGLTLAHDYLASDGTTVTWDLTANAGYNNNITGIGRDINTALDQPKSLSVNATGVSLTMDHGSSFADKNFLLWGDDAGAGTSGNVPAGVSLRSNRIWKTALTGAASTTANFSIDLQALGLVNTTTASSYSILIDNDTDFSSVTTVHTAGATLVGNILSFTGVPFGNNNFFTIAVSGYGQPGGVAGMVFWVKADAGVQVPAAVNTWFDQGGYNNAVQLTSANQPVQLPSDINFNPTVNFSGSTQFLSLSSAPADLNSTIFTVGAPTVNSNWRTMFRGTTVHHPIIIQSGGTGLGFYDNISGGYKGSGFTWLQNEVAVVGLEMRTGDVNFRKNGTQGGSINSISLTGGFLNSFGNYTTNSQQFGRIGETIIYNTASPLSTTQKSKIESYLAVKYGITLTHDYLASNGTTFWDATVNASYPNNLTAIARDDASALDQRKSKSSATGAILTLQKNTPLSQFGTDLTFMVAGDDAATLSATTAGVPSGFPLFPMRVTRIWRAQSSAVVSADVSFDLGTGIYTTTNAGDYSLLVSSTPDFIGSTPITGASIAGGMVTFTGVSIPNGSYFTLGLPIVASPGGVLNGLRVWLKADAGVSSDPSGVVAATDLGNVQRWNDQTSLGNNAINTGTPIYNTTANTINFNPTVYYDGASGHNLTYSSTTQYSLITIAKLEGTLNRRAFSSRIGNALLGFWNGREDVMYMDGNPSILGGAAASTNPRLYTLTRASSGAYQFFRTGLNLSSGGASNNSTFQLGIANGGTYSGESTKEYVSEVVQYDRDLTLSELNKVHSYMAIKYGLTLNQSTPFDYINSAGAVVWNATTNATYANDITVIGRDDFGGLDQRKSKSVNPGSVLTVEKVTPATKFTLDNQFVATGSDAGSLGATNANVPTAFPVFPMRVTRVWRTQLKGATPQSVNISFDLGTGIYNSGVATQYSLLINNASADFIGSTPITGGTISSNVITFANVTLNDGDFFTLGLPLVPSPGGVIAGLRVWLKADAGVSSDLNGAVPATDLGTVQQWNDQTSLHNNGVATGAPVFNLTTNLINFNPTVYYNGSSGHNLPYSATTQHSLITVGRLEGPLNQRLVSSRIGNVIAGWYNNREDVVYLDGNPSVLGGIAATTNPRLYSLTRASSGAYQFLRNGLNLSSAGSSTNSVIQLALGNGGATAQASRGYMSEAIQYDRDLNPAELTKVQSYLAIKYGVSLDQSVPSNYVSATGLTIWDGTLNASYPNDITGVGRDDASGLVQLKSKSINLKAIVTIDEGASFPVDKSFVLAASDNTLLTPTRSGTPAGFPYRLGKTWRAQVTGAPGPVSISFDLSGGIYNTGNAADYSLLISNAGTDFSAATPYTTGAAFNMAGTVITFTGVNFTNGDYFTLGMPIVPGPGGVVNNLQYWIKADLGVFGGANASQWNDNSGNGFNVTQLAPGSQPAVLSNRLNFNPSVQFNGVNNNMTLPGGILGNATYTNANVFAVSRANAIVNQAIYYEGAAGGGGQFDALIPWSNNNIYFDAGNSGTNRLNVNWGGFINNSYLWSMTSATTPMPSGALQDIYRNGQRIGTDLTMNSYTGNGSVFNIGSVNASSYFNGELSELAIYTGPLTALQLQQIQSYMALKYGITLNQITAQDYVSSAGTVVFHATTTHANYNRDIAGIGKDASSGLDQRKSKSINTPADIFSAANTDFAAPGVFAADGQYLVWGNNGSPVSSDVTAPTITHGGESIVRQILRTWSTDLTGTPSGSVVIEIDMTQVSGPTGLGTNDISAVRLLVDDNATFGEGTPTEHSYPATALAGKAYFTVPYGHLAAGQGFVSLGSINATTAPLFTPAPGGIAGDVRLWMKADVGVLGGGTASQWTDQSPNGFVASQLTGTNQPTVLNGRLNNNPALGFDGVNDDMTITNGVLRNNVYNNVFIYSVSRTNLIKQAKVFAENNATGGQFGYYTPWVDANIYWDAGDANASNRLVVNWGGTINTPYLWSLGGTVNGTTPAGFKQDIARNGLRIGSDITMAPFTGNFQNSTIGSQLGTNFYNGELSEVLMVTSLVTPSQQQRIHSYFALKYGLTLNQSTPTDYYSSINSVVYHATTTHSGFKSDIAGIGRDDNSTLDQRKSSSVNTPADIFTVANSDFTFPTLMSGDRQFLVWGNNAMPYASDASVPTFTHGAVVLQKRLARTWSTDLTGAPTGSAVIEFNMDLIGGPGGLGTNFNSAVRLIIDSDPTFGNGLGSEITRNPDGGFAPTGGKVYFTVPYGLIPAGQGFITLASTDGVNAPLAISLPGGVAVPMRLWLKADKGVTGVGTASAWADQSGNGFSAVQATNQPAIVANRINTNPAIQFNGTNTNMSIVGGIFGTSTYTDLTVFEIARTNVVSSAQSFYENVAGGSFDGYTPFSDNTIYWDAGNTGTNRLNVNWGGTANTPYAWTLAASTTSTASGAFQDIYRNGLRLATDAVGTNAFTGNNSNFFIGSGNGGNFYNGDIAEYIVYPVSLNASQQQRVQSYLGIKYGLTVNQATPTNYVSSDGTVVWDATVNSSYKSDIAGIGRDIASGLDQQKSQSVNSKAALQIESQTPITTDRTFLTWGSDNGTFAVSTTGAFPGYQYRINRTWRAQTTGSPGTFTVSIDLSQGIYNSGNNANYQLIVKGTDNNFSTGATGYAGTFNGNTLVFTGVAITNGAYFSLGMTSFPAPGGVVANMQFWVKANAGVTASPTVSLWADQSGTLNNAVQNSTGAQPAFVSPDINYNPSVNFSNGSSVMSLTTPPPNLNSTIFTIGVPVINTNWRTMFRGAVNDHPLIIQQTGTALGYYDGDNVGFKSSGFTWLQNEIATVALEMRAGNVNFRKNGTQGATIGTINLAGLNLDFFGNYQGNNQNFGRIPETVIYNGATQLTVVEKSRVESYFAIKYGLTLTHDYLASDATNLWNVTTNATYTRDMAGIGRDDASALSQKQSASSNTGNVLAIGNGTGALFADNATNTNTFTAADKSFLLWGHNGGNLSGLGVSDFGTTTNGEVIKTRTARAWLSQETGTVGTVRLRFDLSTVKGVGGVIGANDLSKVRLLIDANGVFATGSFSVAPTTSNNGTGIIEFEYDFEATRGFYFSLGSIDLATAPLPITLVEFDATANEDQVDLDWITASEVSNDYFVIQSTATFESWTSVDTVKGKGTTTERSVYHTIDPKPFIGKSYYRLMQVDFDGTKTFSDPKLVEFYGSLKLFPNPTSGRREVMLEVPSVNSSLEITITNLLGQDVYRQVIKDLEAKKQIISIPVGDLRAGEYLVRVFDGTSAHYRKLVVD